MQARADGQPWTLYIMGMPRECPSRAMHGWQRLVACAKLSETVLLHHAGNLDPPVFEPFMPGVVAYGKPSVSTCRLACLSTGLSECWVASITYAIQAVCAAPRHRVDI